jgi:hypothetical protein
MDLEHRTAVIDAEHRDLRQTDKDLADACRVLFDGWADEAGASHAVRLAATSLRAGDVVTPSDLKRPIGRASDRRIVYLGRARLSRGEVRVRLRA